MELGAGLSVWASSVLRACGQALLQISVVIILGRDENGFPFLVLRQTVGDLVWLKLPLRVAQ
eukprot:4268226-Prorocentrum_lima.AAC.1